MPQINKFHHILADTIFILFALAYAILACVGTCEISGKGIILDSDLQTYAQGMAGERFPFLFAEDPVIGNVSEANSIPNLQRILASSVFANDHFGLALIMAGGCAIFIFYAGWYMLGRFLYRQPVLAALLSLCMGITVWVGWGTFWGVTHSDPVPRVFFAAFMPFLLVLAICAIKNVWLRPLAMFCAGIAMWLHGISALNCGAMFFMAFVFLKAKQCPPATHLANLILCLVCFFIPVLVFLWPSLGQSRHFSPEELAMFGTVFDLRWHADYGRFGSRILEFLNPAKAPAILVLCGAASWFITRKRCVGELKILWAMCPFFVLALIIVSFFCWAETEYAPSLGRLPMGHELVRGLRFLVPISWLMIGAAVASYCKPPVWKVMLIAVAVCLLLFTTDRQYAAARFALGKYTGQDWLVPEYAKKQKRTSENYRMLLEKVEKIVPAGEAIFSNEEIMAVRYAALRPLSHTFKDGYVFFYNKDPALSRQWLNLEKLVHSAADGYVSAWLQSGAPWLLAREPDPEIMKEIEKYGGIKMNFQGWILAQRKIHADNSGNHPHETE